VLSLLAYNRLISIQKKSCPPAECRNCIRKYELNYPVPTFFDFDRRFVLRQTLSFLTNAQSLGLSASLHVSGECSGHSGCFFDMGSFYPFRLFIRWPATHHKKPKSLSNRKHINPLKRNNPSSPGIKGSRIRRGGNIQHSSTIVQPLSLSNS
jgi:hypothetical protein